MQFVDDKNVAHILIHEDVTEDLAAELNFFIYGLGFMPEVTEIHISLNSLGGSVLGGFSIFSALQNSDKKIFTKIEGLACSIASWIFFAGDVRTATEYSTLMIHNPSGGDEKSLLAIKESLMTVYKSFFSDESELNRMMNEETWLNPSQLLEKGIISEIIYTNSNVELEINNSTDLHELHALCNQVNKKRTTPIMKKSLTDKFKEELVKLKNKFGIKNEVTLVNEEETPEEEKPKDDEAEEEGEDSAYQELLDIIATLTEKVEALMKSNEDAEAENKALKNQNQEDEKIKVLTEAGIENKEFDKWLKLDLDQIKNLSKTLKVSVKSHNPKIITNVVKDFKDLTREEKLVMAERDPESYAIMFTNSGKK